MVWLYIALLPASPLAQELSFYHLSKKEGLSDNQVSAVTMDRNGLLWVGTSEGLNCYDGYTVKRFYKEDFPEVQNSSLQRMVCDDKNRLWLHFADKQVVLLDENRKFHTITVMNEGKKVTMDYLFPMTAKGVFLLSGLTFYTPDSSNPLQLHTVKWKADTTLKKTFQRINTWDENKLVFSGSDLLLLFDMNQLKITDSIRIPGIVAAVKLNDEEALITSNENDKLCKVSFKEKRIIKSYGKLKDQYGDEMHVYPRSIYHVKDNEYIFTSAYAGVYIFDSEKENLVRYKHDPVNNRSISANNTSFLFSDTSGYFFITSNSTGISYFNTRHYLAGWQPSFKDDKTGKIYDGYINSINEDANGDIWIGAQNGLMRWNRETNTTQFLPYGEVNGQSLKGIEEVRVVHIDKKSRMWLGLNRYGIVILNEKKQVIKYLNSYTKDNTIPNLIYDIKEAPDGNTWIATSRGLVMVNTETFKVLPPSSNPAYERLADKYCQTIWFRSGTEAWVGTTGAAYKINLVDYSWQRLNKSNGLIDENVFCFTDDADGRVYIGTNGGLNILSNDKVIQTYNRTNGLRSNRCEGLIRDNNGKIWIGNDNCLICFNPLSKQFIVFDEGVGLSDAGFKPFAYFKNKKGELFWGSDKGISYFYPDRLRRLQLPLQANIHTVTTPDSSYWLADSKNFAFKYSGNTVNFAFSAIDLYSSENIVYKYKLEGIDNEWKTTSSLREVSYNKLPPGDYTFKVMASKDGQRWVEAANTVQFEILVPWWRSRWFIISCIVALVGAISYIMYLRNKKIKSQQEQIETEQAINYFASSMYDQTNADNILWDVARNCISRLNFEDCVIYLKDDHRDVLIQKAAWGPKTTEENKIINPLEIVWGKGIVGSVAQNGKAEIIADTSKEPRYIVDDTRRFSEIAVPILYNGKVLGVIDSEHSSKNFFTQKHLSILTSIAALCANKLMRVKAEEETQKANLEVLEHQRKTVEAQLKSLRLQMSPHFLFNSLNSIQQMILSGDATAATLYLSKFSRLLRLVLSHSDKEKVTLKEELETLSLYIELESLRFKDSFQYEIICDDNVDKDDTRIPTLLIQPFVENAIWHGLLHKEGLRTLMVKFSEDTYENLVCIVEDNGIGREAAGNINQQNHTGKGIAVATERLNTYNEQYAVKSRVYIEDLLDIRGRATGTRVIVTLPLLN